MTDIALTCTFIEPIDIILINGRILDLRFNLIQISILREYNISVNHFSTYLQVYQKVNNLELLGRLHWLIGLELHADIIVSVDCLKHLVNIVV